MAPGSGKRTTDAKAMGFFGLADQSQAMNLGKDVSLGKDLFVEDKSDS